MSLELALEWAAAGYKVVPVAITTGKKKPAVGHSRKECPQDKCGVYHATDDPEVIRSWSWPFVGVQLVGRVVVDIDPRNDGVRPDVPDTHTVSTLSDPPGQHLWYRGTSTWSAMEPPWTGVDLKHGAGAYVVAYGPPPAIEDLVEWDESWLPWQEIKPYRGNVLEEIMLGVSEGWRSNTLWRYAAYLRGQVFGITLAEMEEKLAEAARGCTPPFDEADAVDMAQRAYDQYDAATVDRAADRLIDWDALEAEVQEDLKARRAVKEAVHFPTFVLPPVLRRFVEEGAKSVGCPEDWLGTAGLVALGTALGRFIELDVDDGGGWVERPALWAAIVGPKGMRKSPALKPCVAPILAKHEEYHQINAQRWAEEQKKPAKERKPIEALKTRVDDATLQGLQRVLKANPKGVINYSDELVGWVRGMSEFKGGLGRDRQQWLSLWSFEAVSVERAGDESGLGVFIPRPFVSVLGGVQPSVLSDLTRRDDGLFERLLLAQGNPKPMPLRRGGIPSEAVAEYEALWGQLHDRGLAAAMVLPRRVTFTDEAWAEFSQWHDETLAEAEKLPEGLRGVWSKMVGQCARIALILHECQTLELEMTADTVRAAIALSEYYKGQAKAVADAAEILSFQQAQYAEQLEQLARYLANHPGIQVKEIRKNGPKWCRSTKVLTQALADLGIDLVASSKEEA